MNRFSFRGPRKGWRYVGLCEFNLRINNQLGVGISVGPPHASHPIVSQSPSSVQQIFIFTDDAYSVCAAFARFYRCFEYKTKLIRRFYFVLSLRPSRTIRIFESWCSFDANALVGPRSTTNKLFNFKAFNVAVAGGSKCI